MKQRSKLANAVAIWRLYFQHKALNDGWQRHAETHGTPMSGYNLILKSVMRMVSLTPDPSYPTSVLITPNGRALFTMTNIVSGTQGDEVGLFVLHWGNYPDRLHQVSDLQIRPDGTILTPVLGNSGQTVYYQLSRIALRSGITEALLG